MLQTILLVGDAVTDRPGREFCSFGDLAASSFGVAFRADTKLDCADAGESPVEGVFRKAVAGAVETVALLGDPAEPFSSPGGTTYVGFIGSPAIENTGAVAFTGSVTGVIATSGLYRCDPGTCPAAPASALLVRGNVDQDGNAFRSFSQPAISSARDVAFLSKMSGGPGGVFNGVYVRRAAGTVDTIAKTGDPVPNSSPAATFRIIVNRGPAMSPAGKVAFKARIKRFVRPKNREGIFVAESPSGAFLDGGAGF